MPSTCTPHRPNGASLLVASAAVLLAAATTVATTAAAEGLLPNQQEVAQQDNGVMAPPPHVGVPIPIQLKQQGQLQEHQQQQADSGPLIGKLRKPREAIDANAKKEKKGPDGEKQQQRDSSNTNDIPHEDVNEKQDRQQPVWGKGDGNVGPEIGDADAVAVAVPPPAHDAAEAIADALVGLRRRNDVDEADATTDDDNDSNDDPWLDGILGSVDPKSLDRLRSQINAAVESAMAARMAKEGGGGVVGSDAADDTFSKHPPAPATASISTAFFNRILQEMGFIINSIGRTIVIPPVEEKYYRCEAIHFKTLTVEEITVATVSPNKLMLHLDGITIDIPQTGVRVKAVVMNCDGHMTASVEGGSMAVSITLGNDGKGHLNATTTVAKPSFEKIAISHDFNGGVCKVADWIINLVVGGLDKRIAEGVTDMLPARMAPAISSMFNDTMQILPIYFTDPPRVTAEGVYATLDVVESLDPSTLWFRSSYFDDVVGGALNTREDVEDDGAFNAVGVVVAEGVKEAAEDATDGDRDEMDATVPKLKANRRRSTSQSKSKSSSASSSANVKAANSRAQKPAAALIIQPIVEGILGGEKKDDGEKENEEEKSNSLSASKKDDADDALGVHISSLKNVVDDLKDAPPSATTHSDAIIISRLKGKEGVAAIMGPRSSTKEGDNAIVEASDGTAIGGDSPSILNEIGFAIPDSSVNNIFAFANQKDFIKYTLITSSTTDQMLKQFVPEAYKACPGCRVVLGFETEAITSDVYAPKVKFGDGNIYASIRELNVAFSGLDPNSNRLVPFFVLSANGTASLNNVCIRLINGTINNLYFTLAVQSLSAKLKSSSLGPLPQIDAAMQYLYPMVEKYGVPAFNKYFKGFDFPPMFTNMHLASADGIFAIGADIVLNSRPTMALVGDGDDGDMSMVPAVLMIDEPRHPADAEEEEEGQQILMGNRAERSDGDAKKSINKDADDAEEFAADEEIRRIQKDMRLRPRPRPHRPHNGFLKSMWRSVKNVLGFGGHHHGKHHKKDKKEGEHHHHDGDNKIKRKEKLKRGPLEGELKREYLR